MSVFWVLNLICHLDFEFGIRGMLLFGITGGIGSGKSAVCSYLKKKNIPIIAADPLAKQLMTTDLSIKKQLIAAFGEDVYADEGQLNTNRLSQLVFENPAARQQINQIVHPVVLAWIKQESTRLFQQEGHQLIGVEAALIYESQMDEMLDFVVVVDAPVAKRTKWLQLRNKLSDAEVQNRMQSQMPVEQKRERADYIIENDGNLEKLAQKVDKFYNWLQSRL